VAAPRPLSETRNVKDLSHHRRQRRHRSRNRPPGGRRRGRGHHDCTPFAHVWRIADGKLKRFDMYTDTLLVDRALRADRS